MAGGLCIDEEPNTFFNGLLQIVKCLFGIRTIVGIMDLNGAAGVLFFVLVPSILVTRIYCCSSCQGQVNANGNRYRYPLTLNGDSNNGHKPDEQRREASLPPLRLFSHHFCAQGLIECHLAVDSLGICLFACGNRAPVFSNPVICQ